MKKNLIYILGAIAIIIIVALIVRNYLNRNPLDVDVSDIELNVKVERFDLELYQSSESWDGIIALREKYGLFFEVYNDDIIGIGGIENSSYLVYLNTFLSDYAVIEAGREVKKQYSDLNQLNDELTGGFKHLLYYFPDEEIPRIVSFIAGFNQSIVLLDGFIAIGLDKYLGQDCPLYDMMEIPDFAKFEMTQEQVAIDVMTAWATDKYPYLPESDNLLNQMVYNGKILYFLDAMFPDFDEARKCKYTHEQLQFCYQFERDIWTNFLENKLLFETDHLTIRKFVDSAPFTHQFGPDSPPRVANWIGLQIVRSYIKNNDVSLQQLMEETDYQKILNLSEYNPKY
ncbi:MAG: hypothetical protein JXR36_10725 [Bacteroidales bacterium]|nr:hypothetical protein [Bacteroidales bacterium]